MLSKEEISEYLNDLEKALEDNDSFLLARRYV